MKNRRSIATLALLAMLSGCGGDSGSLGSAPQPAPTPTPTPSPTPTPTTAAGCSLRARQDWIAAAMKEWYLFYDTLPTNLDPTPYTTAEDYLDALTATARAQNKDRYFTYLTSITAENAYYSSGASAGFGIRLGIDSSSNRLFVIESFEGAPALNANIDRGAEIVAIGTTASNEQTVTSIVASQGTAGLTNALGPDTAGTTRVLKISDASGTRDVTLTKTDFSLLPVSTRYGAKVIDDGGTKVGYLNLRTFIDTADQPLRSAFDMFRQQGITKVIVDFRYNGGGLLSIAELMGDLMGAARSTSDVFDYVTFRPEKSAENSTRTFSPQSQSIAPMKLAFIGTHGTASASELVMAAAIPYFHGNAGLIGTNTYGKPVGQIALDNPAGCDDRLRVIAFALQNANRQGAYYNGLAGTMEASCQASDDIGHQMGDPLESSTKVALDYLAGRSCTAIPAASASLQSGQTAALKFSQPKVRELLTPQRPNTQQREVPGLF